MVLNSLWVEYTRLGAQTLQVPESRDQQKTKRAAILARVIGHSIRRRLGCCYTVGASVGTALPNFDVNGQSRSLRRAWRPGSQIPQEKASEPPN